MEHHLHLQTLSPFSDVSSDFVVIMRQFISQTVCSVVERFSEVVVDEAEYQNFIIAIPSGFLMAFKRQITVSVKLCALQYWTCRLCICCSSSSDFVLDCLSYFSLIILKRMNVVLRPCFFGYFGDVSNGVLTTSHRYFLTWSCTSSPATRYHRHMLE